MTTISHGAVAPVLADGSSLLQKMTLTSEQSSAVASDLALLTSANAQARAARLLNIGVRVSSVIFLVGLACLVIAQSINLVLAGIIAVVLLFSTDILNVIDRKLSSKREVSLKGLKFADTVFGFTGSFSFNKTRQQKIDDYRTLLRTGELSFSNGTGHRILLNGGAGEPHVLLHVA